ncbi:MAG TPA: PatB family C-S lyase, partial [Bacillota bacterium]|nr:PatB family C-S lyase [Bacillota bacterium]
SSSFDQSVVSWLKYRFRWEVSPDWITHSPGVVTSIITAILAYTHPGDKILIQSPVYYPFYSCVTTNDRELVINPLQLQGDSYLIDFDDLENKLRRGVKMMILCSPHNPVGRVWKEAELTQLAGLCSQYQVMLVSDEIHGDLIYPGHQQISIASLSEKPAQNSVTLISPTKTFNLAGLAESVAIIPNPKLRHQFQQTLRKTGAGMLNIFGMVAGEAAYAHGAPWLEELLRYLDLNRQTLVEYFQTNIPRIKLFKPEGTYLAWLDCRELGIAPGELKEFFVQQTGVGLNDGSIFGTDGAGFQRINFACPRSLLMEGLQRIEKAVNKLKS